MVADHWHEALQSVVQVHVTIMEKVEKDITHYVSQYWVVSKFKLEKTLDF